MDSIDILDNMISNMNYKIGCVFSEYKEDIKNHLKKIKKESMLQMPLADFSGKASSDLEWIYRARSLEETRYYLGYIHVKNGIAECANGHVLLWCDTQIKENGHYKLDDDKPHDGLMYPDTSKVIPEYDNWQDIQIKKQDASYVVLNNGAVVNAEYFLLITEHDLENWEISFSDELHRALRFKNKTNSRNAALMPMSQSIIQEMKPV